MQRNGYQAIQAKPINIKAFHDKLLGAEFRRVGESLGQNRKGGVKEQKKRLSKGASKELFVLGGSRFLGFLEDPEIRERVEVVGEDGVYFDGV